MKIKRIIKWLDGRRRKRRLRELKAQRVIKYISRELARAFMTMHPVSSQNTFEEMEVALIITPKKPMEKVFMETRIEE